MFHDYDNNSNCFLKECKDQFGRIYIYPREYYVNTLKFIPQGQPIIVVGNPYHVVGGSKSEITATTKEACISRSKKYLENVLQFFQGNHYNVTYHGDSNTPDEDVTFMSSASIFV